VSWRTMASWLYLGVLVGAGWNQRLFLLSTVLSIGHQVDLIPASGIPGPAPVTIRKVHRSLPRSWPGRIQSPFNRVP